MNRIDLLDHGYVRLVDHMGSDLSIARSARVSHNAAWRAGEDHGSDTRLIKYLWVHKHFTPFESVTFTFEVKAPIFVFRQWHRHRTFSFNEVSARYTELPEEFYTPEAQIVGVQSVNSKQGRTLNGDTDERYGARLGKALQVYDSHNRESFALYKRLIAEDWPRELARAVLPVATYSSMFATVNLRNLFAFLTLRRDSHAQYEIRVYADAIVKLIREIVPVAVAAWENG